MEAWPGDTCQRSRAIRWGSRDTKAHRGPRILLSHEVTRPVRLADGETVWGQIAISTEQLTEHSRAWHRAGAVSVGGWGAHVEDTALHTKGELSLTVGPDLGIPMPSGLSRMESGHCHAFPPHILGSQPCHPPWGGGGTEQQCGTRPGQAAPGGPWLQLCTVDAQGTLPSTW